ncbi:beta-3-deoxy-D-manno-oct-2-ulosonic acid transferase [Rhodovulum sulfidophilum]|uniref:Capsular polysaccharide biosynthesis protein n=1 Tax=Rhodovulum visakhapatnamense TaxID=364297 RepID=A0ABS1RBM5_9RHOB|nr:capsular polysaccharide biosynthesis protein [Rhodovulum visakhapatnamense]MBL3569079.1 capsular polysaccharide biosynthesis protein [Rhodovulum visakhapatnamense]MBL3577041.1 capsular polysaccharide biosynthesis protein [Rhodovulum visakhapatnamense]OLS46207.1 beta-3-deoxy-D-manno-oct-2-ulosonic acid transferase [Rhodovulum sulfidophilum]
MTGPAPTDTAAPAPGRGRLFASSAGFLTQARVRRILELAGHPVALGLPGPGDLVAVRGMGRTAARGRRLARRRGAGLLWVEDAPLRSVLPGRARGAGPPLGLMLDRGGPHFDPSRPSDLETLLASHPLDDPDLIGRARAAMARLRAGHLTRYTGFDPGAPVPDPGYVLVIDQGAEDAAVRASGADATTFAAMLAAAELENPGAPVLIKAPPEAVRGLRAGPLGPEQAQGRVRVLTEPVSPWALLEGAVAVYTVSSQMGFEAILAGHRPRVFGQPFYAGWGLTEDDRPLARRARPLSPAQLFAAAMILAPRWYDPFHDRLCPLEDALAIFEAETRAWREDRAGWVASGMRLWKRPTLQRFFGTVRPMRFAADPAGAGRLARASGRRAMAWAGGSAPLPPGTVRVEDGFLRSCGLGAALVPPLSLVLDDLGIHYDPGQESRIERLIAGRPGLEPVEAARTARLVEFLIASGISICNSGGCVPPALPTLPPGHRILVPGQVEDDASIRVGCPAERDNLALLARCRAENPEAVLIYAPHPDVAAGLRPGGLAPGVARAHADLVLPGAIDPGAALALIDEVWTLSSGLGFEALLRGVPVTCLGLPFYAGWGLTRDLAAPPARRRARPDLLALAHAALIAYPRYLDPVTGRPCPVEIAAERLAAGQAPRRGARLRALARVQGALAGQAWLWRR